MSLKYKHTTYTLSEWTVLNPVIVDKEIVIESDTNRLKVGNGIDEYLDLEYIDKYVLDLISISERNYADNTEALAEGLVANQFYHTAGVVKVVI